MVGQGLSRRNHRRSNSCTDLVARQEKARTKEEGAVRTTEGATSVTMAGMGRPVASRSNSRTDLEAEGASVGIGRPAGRRAGCGAASNPRPPPPPPTHTRPGW